MRGRKPWKNELLCTDFLVGHIRQSLPDESGNAQSGLKTGN